jgi:hypothetical protein
MTSRPEALLQLDHRQSTHVVGRWAEKAWLDPSPDWAGLGSLSQQSALRYARANGVETVPPVTMLDAAMQTNDARIFAATYRFCCEFVPVFTSMPSYVMYTNHLHRCCGGAVPNASHSAPRRTPSPASSATSSPRDQQHTDG